MELRFLERQTTGRDFLMGRKPEGPLHPHRRWLFFLAGISVGPPKIRVE
jgi:hypothetical protein